MSTHNSLFYVERDINAKNQLAVTDSHNLLWVVIIHIGLREIFMPASLMIERNARSVENEFYQVEKA